MSNLPPLNTRRVSFADGLTIRVDERGSGHPILILHGGGGTQPVAGIAAGLSKAHVLVPTHPGFGGEPRPEWLNSIDDLAYAYLDLLEQLELRDVLVIGYSMGGWIASAMALCDTSHLMRGLVLINAAGIEVEGHPVVDISNLTPDEISALIFHNPAAFRVDPATVTPEQVEGGKANARAAAVYDQGLMSADPKLKRRLSHVHIPVLVAWGESDRILDLEYGRAYAQAFPDAHFEPIPEAGHMSPIEQPERLMLLIRRFAISTRVASDV